MLEGETQIRVRYGETDQMSVVYYGNYAQYYEIGRTELIRKFNLSYKMLENAGIIMPVVELHVNYIYPARYDEILTVKTMVKEKPGVKIRFDYEIFNSGKMLINQGYTILIFSDAGTGKPTRPPKSLMEKIEGYF